MRLSPEQIQFLNGYLDAFDDLPDGAWQAACENAINHIQQYKGRGFDIWLQWCKQTAEPQAPEGEKGLNP